MADGTQKNLDGKKKYWALALIILLLGIIAIGYYTIDTGDDYTVSEDGSEQMTDDAGTSQKENDNMSTDEESANKTDGAKSEGDIASKEEIKDDDSGKQAEFDPTTLEGEELASYLNNKLMVSDFKWYNGPSGNVTYVDAKLYNKSNYYLTNIYAVIRYRGNEENVRETKAKKIPFNLAPGKSQDLKRFMVGFLEESASINSADIYFVKGNIKKNY